MQKIIHEPSEDSPTAEAVNMELLRSGEPLLKN
jgi:hypothetical protein